MDVTLPLRYRTGGRADAPMTLDALTAPPASLAAPALAPSAMPSLPPLPLPPPAAAAPTPAPLVLVPATFTAPLVPAATPARSTRRRVSVTEAAEAAPTTAARSTRLRAKQAALPPVDAGTPVAPTPTPAPTTATRSTRRSGAVAVAVTATPKMSSRDRLSLGSQAAADDDPWDGAGSDADGFGGSDVGDAASVASRTRATRGAPASQRGDEDEEDDGIGLLSPGDLEPGAGAAGRPRRKVRIHPAPRATGPSGTAPATTSAAAPGARPVTRSMHSTRK